MTLYYQNSINISYKYWPYLFLLDMCFLQSFFYKVYRLGQWFSNWGPRSFWGPRDKFSGTAKHLPKKLKRRS